MASVLRIVRYSQTLLTAAFQEGKQESPQWSRLLPLERMERNVTQRVKPSHIKTDSPPMYERRKYGGKPEFFDPLPHLDGKAGYME
jgi:hypothetical protein